MPTPIGPILVLWSVWLLTGSEAGVGTIPAPRQYASMTLAASPPPAIEATSPRIEWPWRISEADTIEDDSSEGDDFGPSGDRASMGRPFGDRARSSPILDHRGSFRPPVRSPILRC